MKGGYLHKNICLFVICLTGVFRESSNILPVEFFRNIVPSTSTKRMSLAARSEEASVVKPQAGKEQKIESACTYTKLKNFSWETIQDVKSDDIWKLSSAKISEKKIVRITANSKALLFMFLAYLSTVYLNSKALMKIHNVWKSPKKSHLNFHAKIIFCDVSHPYFARLKWDFLMDFQTLWSVNLTNLNQIWIERWPKIHTKKVQTQMTILFV